MNLSLLEMFNLNDTERFWLYSRPVDMRKSFCGLSGIVSNLMGQDSCNGDAYVFVNKSRNMMKVLRKEEGGMVIYSKRLDIGRLPLPPVGTSDEVISSLLTGIDIIEMVRSAINSPYIRRLKLLSSRL